MNASIEPSGPRLAGSRRWLTLAGAGIAGLVVIAVLGSLVLPTETDAPGSSAPAQPASTQSVPTPTTSASPTSGADQSPVPLPQPTTQTQEDEPEPPFPPSPTPVSTTEPAPTEPGRFASFETIAGVIVATDGEGIWTQVDPDQPWTLTPMHYPQQRWCTTTVGENIAVVDNRAGEEPSVDWFSPSRPGWLADRRQPLPSIADGAGTLIGGNYCQAIVVDDKLVFATATQSALIFVVEQLDGSFGATAVSYPDESVRGDRPSFVEARIMRHRDTIVVAHCSYYIDTGCLNTYFQFDPILARSDGPAKMTWAEAGGSVILPSHNNDVVLYADLGGSINRGFDLRQVGDEVWTLELIEHLGNSRGPDFSAAVGVWAAGPLGAAPSVLGTGYWPRLSLDGDRVLADMAPLGEPGPGVHWNTPATDEELAAAADRAQQWWSFDRDGDLWRTLDGNPAATAAEVPADSLFTWSPLRWSLIQHSQQQAPPQSDEPRSWDAVVGHGRPFIVGDQAFSRDGSYVLSESRDRGISWSTSSSLSFSPGQEFCAAVTDAGFAYFADNTATPATMTVESADSTEQIDWPTMPRLFMGDGGSRPCRPMYLGSRWWIGELDHNNRFLRITSTADGDQFESHTINLSGPWRDALPGPGGHGTVHLYPDNQWFVIRLCRSGDGFPCSQSADLRFNASLFNAAPDSGGHVYLPTEVEMDLPVIGYGTRDLLQSVGDELFRLEINARVGSYDTAARMAKYGSPLEPVDGAWVDVRLRYDQTMRCVYARAYHSDPPVTCETENGDGTWQPVLGTIAVDWATVPAGTPVSFFYRTGDGRIMVVPS